MSDFVLELPDGGSHRFASYTIDQYESLQAQIAASIRRTNRALADEVNFSNQMDRARFLKEADPRSIDVSVVDEYVSDDRRACNILANALIANGLTPEAAQKVLCSQSVMNRALIAKHVVGLIDLTPVPEEDREASLSMKLLVQRKCPGLDVGGMKVRDFYSLFEKLLPPPEEGTPQSWFEKNTVPGSARKVA